MKLENTEEFKKLKDYLNSVEISGDFVIGIPYILGNEENIKTLNKYIAEKHPMNDYELLKNVKYSFAMKNAIPPIKEIAYQVIQSNDEASVTQKIKEILKGEF